MTASIGSTITSSEEFTLPLDRPVLDPNFDELLLAHGMRPALVDSTLETTRSAARLGHTLVPFVIMHTSPLETLEETEIDVIIPGYSGTAPAYSGLCRNSAATGNATILFNPLREMHDIFHPGRLLPETVNAIVQHVHSKLGIVRFGLKTHSWGSAAGIQSTETINQSDNGPRIEYLEMIDSAGATNHNLASLAPGAMYLLLEMAKAAALHPQAIPSTFVHNMSNPLRSFAELLEASNTRTSPERIDALRRNFGVTVTALFHEHDPLFPGKMAKAAIDGAVDHFELAPRGGHLTPILDPRAVVAALRDSRQRAHSRHAALLSS